MKTDRSSLPEEKIEPPSDELIQKVENILTSKLDPIKHLKQIDYPRRAGTEGEKKAADYIFTTLQEYGHQPKTQEFYFLRSKVGLNLILPFLFLSWGLLSLINILYLDNNIVISTLILSAPTIGIIVLINFGSFAKYFLRRKTTQIQKLELKVMNQTLKRKEQGKILTSKNIIAEIGSNDAEHHFLFTAHIDSISWKLSMKMLKIFGIVGIISFSFYSAAYLLNVITDLGFDWNFMREFFLLFVILLFLAFLSLGSLFISQNFRGNESHGIIDDGTGIVIILELAKFLKDQNIQNCKFTFGFFGAEEAGLIGSSYYYHKTQFDKNKLQVISFDMIGEKTPLAYIKGVNPIIKSPMDPVFNSRVTEIAKKLNIEIKGSNFIYPASDFAHWLFDGYKTSWFTNKSEFIHSKRDNLDNVNEIMVNNALRIIIGYVIEFLS